MMLWPLLILFVLVALLYLNYRLVSTHINKLFGEDQNFIFKYLGAADVATSALEASPEKTETPGQRGSSDFDKAEVAPTEAQEASETAKDDDAGVSDALSDTDDAQTVDAEAEREVSESADSSGEEKVLAQESARGETEEEKAADKEQQPRREAKGTQRAAVLLEVNEPDWRDFPLVKKPRVRFVLKPNHGRELWERTLALGEGQTLSVASGCGYTVEAKMQAMSRVLRPFNWDGKFNVSRSFYVAPEATVRITYVTPPTLRSAARLDVEVLHERD